MSRPFLFPPETNRTASHGGRTRSLSPCEQTFPPSLTSPFSLSSLSQNSDRARTASPFPRRDVDTTMTEDGNGFRRASFSLVEFLEFCCSPSGQNLKPTEQKNEEKKREEGIWARLRSLKFAKRHFAVRLLPFLRAPIEDKAAVASPSGRGEGEGVRGK